MEALATYLIKSSVWLTGFALVYALFLRNERFFVLNRIYLVSGILFSIVFSPNEGNELDDHRLHYPSNTMGTYGR